MKLKVVLVEWYDAASMNEWKTPEEPFVEREPVISAGIIVAKTKQEVVICTAVSYDRAYASDFAIPVGCIKSIRTIHTLDWKIREIKHRKGKGRMRTRSVGLRPRVPEFRTCFHRLLPTRATLGRKVRS